MKIEIIKRLTGLALAAGFVFLMLFHVTGCSADNELEWVQEDGYRWAEVHTGFFGSTGFKKREASQTGIDFRNDVSDETIERNRHYTNGSGVAVGDVTGNGFPDIYFASLEGPNRLFENLGGYRFEDITEQAGVAHDGYNSTGVAIVDVNGNGYLDIVIASLTEGKALYLNDGFGSFELMEESGLGASNGAHTLAFADINGNGLLDLYVTNYRLESVRDLYGPEALLMENTVVETEDGGMRILPEFQDYFEVIEIDGRAFRQESGAYDELYINKGDGRFERADPLHYFPVNDDRQPGLFQDWGLTGTFRDITGNGHPDLYVANDFWTPDRLWINQGDGTFHAAPHEAIRSQSFSSMGIDFSDINRNGKTDFVVTEMLSGVHERRMRQYSDYMDEYQGSVHYNQNSVYLNRGDQTFAQLAWYTGLEATEWSWATCFLDVNLNGYEDLIVATGFYRDYLDMDVQREISIRYQQMGEAMLEESGEFLMFPPLLLNNQIFRNNGDLTFTDVSRDWGFDIEDISLGMAIGDLNNKGTHDLIINRFNDEALIYENTTNNPRIAVRLKGESPNTAGIGAKVELIGGPVRQYKEMTAGGNYLSDPHKQVVFAADKNRNDHTILVTWRNGTQSRIENVKANRIYEIDEADTARYVDGNLRSQDSPEPVTEETPGTMFEDISDAIDHVHHESSYDEFQRAQPLLPRELSRKGPGVAWLDYNNSGFDDLFITSGRGGSLTVIENPGTGEFRPVTPEVLQQRAPGDQVSIAGWREGGQFRLVVGSSNYEQGNPRVASAYIYTIDADGSVAVDSIPGILSATGPVTAADYTGNGAVDLFIGGHFLPGGYPRNATSRLYMNHNGRFIPDERNARTFEEVGMVTGALFADFTENGRQDLLVSTEWGPVKLFENRDGRFIDITEEMGLDQWKGWWNGIASGDFTNNGLTDFVATNLGKNTPYRTNSEHPVRLYYADFNMNNRLDIVDAWYHEEMEAYVPRRKLLDFRSVPTILQNVRSHKEFAVSPVDVIFGRDFSDVPSREITTVEHMVFINTGNGFEAGPLPAKAQFSTGHYVGVADFDNDGNEDLFISQNSFEFPTAIPRQDAGRGLILKGDGNGNFKPVPGNESGIKIYGEQRGAALTDFNGNGKVDLAVSRNGGPTKLYKNVTKQRGIRVRLTGPDNNELAVGSRIRLAYTDGSKGPVRTIQTGVGYRSQNSAIQVLGIGGEPSHIEITWFDGTEEEVTVEPGFYEYDIVYHSDRVAFN